MWQLSIRSKIILVLLLTGLACLAAGAIIGYRAGNAALWQSVKERLAGHHEIKRRRVESYVNNQLKVALDDTREAACERQEPNVSIVPYR